MLVAAAGFFLLNTLPADFSYFPFAMWIFVVGVGQGLFASPNTSAIMSAVPARYRGAASGMRATFMNAGTMLSMGIFFSMIIGSLAANLPSAMVHGLSQFALPHAMVVSLSHLPPMAVLFASLLGYNPLAHLIPATVLAHLPASQSRLMLSSRFFPTLIAHAFMKALRVVFIFSAALSLIAAVLSVLRGQRYIYDESQDGNQGSMMAAGGGSEDRVETNAMAGLRDHRR